MRCHQAGVGLISLMTGLLVGAIVIVGLTTIYIDVSRTTSGGERLALAQAQLNAANVLLSKLLSGVGYATTPNLVLMLPDGAQAALPTTSQSTAVAALYWQTGTICEGIRLQGGALVALKSSACGANWWTSAQVQSQILAQGLTSASQIAVISGASCDAYDASLPAPVRHPQVTLFLQSGTLPLEAQACLRNIAQ